jgi:hypothetical protein
LTFKIFSPENICETIGVFVKNTAHLYKTRFLKKKSFFFAEKWQKLQKIVITSTPGVSVWTQSTKDDSQIV